MHNQPEPGHVYLVGAGPGDPDLITVGGLRLIRGADVVVFDRLVHPGLLQCIRLEAERIYVGKAPGKHSTSQDAIHEILVDRARRGLSVARLKGGDPFVFGRGGEECLALAEAGIPFHIVPGVSSAISAPAFAGIPVTCRNISAGFTVVTGHSCLGSDEPDWDALARTGTLVILMGLRNLPRIGERLMAAGLDPDTPAAVIESAATEDQNVVAGTLETIGLLSLGCAPPATIVIGDVVSLHYRMPWFHKGLVSLEDLHGAGIPFAHHRPVDRNFAL